MMWNNGMGYGTGWVFMWLSGIIVLIIVIVLIVLLVRATSNNNSSGNQYKHDTSMPAQQNRALDTLAERYAKGEISEDELEAIKQGLKAILTY